MQAMPVQFILGRAGTGKTHHCFEAVERWVSARGLGAKVLMLMPRQATFMMERQLVARNDGRSLLGVRVVSPESLVREVAPQLAESMEVIAGRGRRLLIALAIQQNAPNLQFFRDADQQPHLAERIDAALGEIEQADVAITDVKRALAGRGDAQQAKLADIELIRSSYQALLGERLDAHRLQQRLLQAIATSALVKDSLVVVDGFADFSPLQRRMLVALATRAERMEIALLLDREPNGEPDDASLFARTARTFRELSHEMRVAGVRIEPSQVCAQTHRFAGGYIAALEACFDRPASAEVEHLSARPDGQKRGTSHGGQGRSDPAPPAGPTRGKKSSGNVLDLPGLFPADLFSVPVDEARPLERPSEPASVRLIEAANDLDEVRIAAQLIREWQLAGVRLRKIGVLCRDLENYAQWVRPVFAEYGIVSFIDQRRSMTHHPLIRFLRSALEIAVRGWRQSAVLEMLKCGLTPLRPEETDRLENYALRHGIDHDGWLKEWDFTSVPAHEDEEPEAALELEESRACSGYRDRALAPIRELADLALAGEIPVQKLIAAVRAIVTTGHVSLAVDQWIKDAPADEAQEHAQCRDAIVELLDAADQLLGGRCMSLGTLAQMLLAAMEDLSIKLAPPTLDQVLVGQVDRSRSPEFDCVILLGMNEGTFPAATSEDSIFSDAERRLLNESNIELNADSASRAMDEQLMGYIAITRSSRQLVLMRPLADEDGRKQSPSGLILRVQAILPALTGERVQLFQPPRYIERGRQAGSYHNEARLAPEVARRLLGDQLRCSATRLERFAACPFQHFVESELALQEREVAEVSSLDLGNAFHAVLDGIGQRMIQKKLDWSSDELRQCLNEQVEQVAHELRDELLLSSERNRYLLDVINRMLGKLIDDQKLLEAKSSYRVAHTEFVFGEARSPLPALVIETPKGRKVSLRGRIDRVDGHTEGPTKSCLVFDYKTSQRSLSLNEVKNGLALQLLIYLMVMRENGHTADGAFYMQLMRPMQSAPQPEERNAEAVSCRPRGILQFEAREHLDPGVAGRSQLFSFFVNKENGLGNEHNTDAVSARDLAKLFEFIRRKVGEIADAMFDGDISIAPYQIGNSTPCAYCVCRPVCRFDTGYNHYRQIAKLRRDAVLDEINPERKRGGNRHD